MVYLSIKNKCDDKKEPDLEHTVNNAINKIEEKGYEADLTADGIPEKNIYKLGFAFEGKDVLVKEKH